MSRGILVVLLISLSIHAGCGELSDMKNECPTIPRDPKEHARLHPMSCIYYCGQDENGIWKYGFFKNDTRCQYTVSYNGFCHNGLCSKYKGGHQLPPSTTVVPPSDTAATTQSTRKPARKSKKPRRGSQPPPTTTVDSPSETPEVTPSTRKPPRKPKKPTPGPQTPTTVMSPSETVETTSSTRKSSKKLQKPKATKKSKKPKKT
uniref:Salivary secreted basic tail protein n=1 Tax=Ornithodoros parkeri TaxID=140564 RepID=A6N9Q7_ORNPR|nr:salivary secreted basic tail protein [Ornithodoros parkeri]